MVKLCGNIYFYNVNKTFSYSLNNESKILYMGQYSKTELLNYFLNLGCFNYINNKLKINKIITVRFFNLAEKNTFFLLAGFQNLIADQDLIINLENETAIFDIFAENNILVNFKIFNNNNIILTDTIEAGSFKNSLIIDRPTIIYNSNYRVKFFNTFTGEELYSLQTYFLTN